MILFNLPVCVNNTVTCFGLGLAIIRDIIQIQQYKFVLTYLLTI